MVGIVFDGTVRKINNERLKNKPRVPANKQTIIKTDKLGDVRSHRSLERGMALVMELKLTQLKIVKVKQMVW